MALTDAQQSDLYSWVGEIQGALFNPITSESPFRTPGEGAIWQQHQLPINDDGMIHPLFTAWAAGKGHAPSLQDLQTTAAMSPVTFPDRADDIKLAQSVLADLEPAVAPTPVVVVPAPVTPTPVAPIPAIDEIGQITVSQLLQWGKDLFTVIGAVATWATSAHSVLGQYLPGASGTAVPLALAALTTGLGAHTVVQKRVAQRALASTKEETHA